MSRWVSILVIASLTFVAVGSISGAKSPTTHSVQPNDTLQSIAERIQVSLRRLAQANVLSPSDRLRVDQVLVIPDPTLPPPQPIAEDKMLKGLCITFYAVGYAPLREHVQALLVQTEPTRR